MQSGCMPNPSFSLPGHFFSQKLKNSRFIPSATHTPEMLRIIMQDQAALTGERVTSSTSTDVKSSLRSNDVFFCISRCTCSFVLASREHPRQGHWTRIWIEQPGRRRDEPVKRRTVTSSTVPPLKRLSKTWHITSSTTSSAFSTSSDKISEKPSHRTWI